jgi:subtilisin family serine protease
MKMIKTLTLGFLVLLCAAAAQAGYLTPGLESQISGKSGDEFVKVLVVLNEQVDFRAMDWELHDAKATIDVRHRVVMESLQEQARKSQGDLLASLEANKASGGIKGYTPHWIVNSVVVVGTVDAIRDLATRPDVERIEADLIVELIEPIESEKVLRTDKNDRGIGITPGVVAINAPQVWNDLGVNGAGVVVGILDTGVDGTHPALADRWRGNFAPASECWLDAAGLGYTFPDDNNSHGTHVMGTITGLADDDTIGVAPGALWIASNIIDSGTGVDFDNGVIASIEFMADPDGNPETTIDMPAVVQNSWGVNENFSGYYDCDSRWWDAIDAAEAAGVCFTWSAGNEGPGSESLRSPGDRAASPTNCFSVGSTITDPPYTISSFSSRGPSGCGGEFAMKPEISAPGSDIYSSVPGGGYGYKSGTSMAGPHVAGVVALMKASNPNIDVITIKEVIMATATDLGSPGEDNDYGHGFINAYEAVLAVMGGIGTVEGVITDSGTGLPLENALVRKVGGYNQDYTDANGYFSMTMPIDDVTLSVTKFGYAEGTIMTTVLEDQVVVENLAIDLLPSGTVSGIVYGPDGNVVENAMVRVAATPLDPVFTDAAGYYSLILPSGVGEFYDIVARASGMGTQAQNVEVLGDLTLDFNLPEWIGDDFETGNFNRFPWEMSGTADWTIDASEYYEGFNSARSGDIGDNQNSIVSLTLDVLAEGEIKFWYKVSSESGWDYLRFLVDGAVIAEWSGEVPWTEFVHTVQPGARTFTFEYDKDTSVSNGSDCGWIDYMELPAVELPGVPQISMDTSPVNMSLGVDSTEDMPLTINNLGDGTLNYALNLTEVGVPSLEVVNPVPHREFGKDEKDEREAVSPVAGFGGPDAFGYSWADSDEPGGPVYSWMDISGDGQVVGSGDDANHGPFTLQFPFSYYGDAYSSVNVCTNGWVSFTSTSTSYNNQGLPDAADPNNVLAVFWDDLNPNSGGTIYYKSEPSRFIVQWQDVPHYGSGGLPLTFQVILNADGSIIYQYQLIQDIDGSTVGIENAAGDDGLLVCFNDASYLHNDLAIRLAPIPPLTWVTADPLVGTVLEGESQDITLHFDSTGLPVGSYAAMLSVGSNDPTQATMTVPINMIVGGVTPVGDLLPRVVQFTGAVPNPFNPATHLKFSIPRDAAVSLKLYDVSGRLVRSLVNESMGAGHHEVFWNGQDQGGRSVASGTYFARLAVDGVITVKSMALVR